MKDNLIYVLLGLLVVAAFAVGLFYGQVSVYKKSGVGANQQGNAQNPGQQQAVPQATPKPLTEEQWSKVLEGATAVKGDDGAEVTIVEFTDYQCPYCARYYMDSYLDIVANYVDSGQVKYILRDLALGFHPNAVPAAMAARCAGDEGKYWEMHDLLFENQTEWSDLEEANEVFAGYAGDLGLNTANFESCMSEEKYKEAVEADAKLAAEVGATGTPSFFINGEILVGAQPYSAFEAAIEKAKGK